MRLRDLLGPVFEDDRFAGLFSERGRPALSPGRLALVSVMQFVEGLTDRQAADAVRSRLDWKYLIGLELRDQGFDASVLAEFRERLAVSGSAEELVFETVLDELREAGFLTAGGRQRTDSTHVVAAVRSVQRLELLGESVRAALEALAVAAPTWLTSWAPAEWFTRYGPRVDTYRLPTAEAEREELALHYGADGFFTLEHVFAPDSPGQLRGLETVEILRRIWVQQFYRAPDGLHLRKEAKGKGHADEAGRPPASMGLVSPYDPDARFRKKRATKWIGYTAQISESSNDDRPHLITYIATHPATEPDVDTTGRVHSRLGQRDLLPDEHYADSAYITAEHILKAARLGVELIGPANKGNQWQSRTSDAYDNDLFAVDWDTLTAICPQGHRNTWSGTGTDRHGNPRIQFTFSLTNCTPCPVRSHCTHAKTAARTVTLRPRDQHELLRRLHTEQDTEEWHRRYGHPAGVEGTISQAVRAFGLRRSRYQGQTKTALQHVLTATAINVTRLDTWLTGTPLGRTRTSHLAALAPSRT
jgi:transposase